ncbi:hypothetical protein N7468_010708 [Penicillium chermesinum]|uniref:CFEM domain-containing protein n=1 Tax=Penicillium chermesinum TaxID=63820 RepID=A0A9W9TAA2_9EURO|nr:uncharacterized protein N7468_010708 [Penicillium chermesinum]KAJ5215029.1 hypothetical protein N7468_010708 [Penicillium chermesinum]KAJ6141472.1 hypothetical protein N7470_009862 [Penicillium chermesinum]
MKPIIIFFTLAYLLSFGAAQGLSSLPKCGQECAINALPKECGLDITCICKDKGFFASVACCITETCNLEEQKRKRKGSKATAHSDILTPHTAEVLESAKSICAPGDVTDLPPSIVCPTASNHVTTATVTVTTASTTNSTAVHVAHCTGDHGDVSDCNATPTLSGTSTGATSMMTTHTLTSTYETTLSTTTSHSDASTSAPTDSATSTTAKATHTGGAAAMNKDAYKAAAGAVALFAFFA